MKKNIVSKESCLESISDWIYKTKLPRGSTESFFIIDDLSIDYIYCVSLEVVILSHCAAPGDVDTAIAIDESENGISNGWEIINGVDDLLEKAGHYWDVYNSEYLD